jgi:hypothetical protein
MERKTKARCKTLSGQDHHQGLETKVIFFFQLKAFSWKRKFCILHVITFFEKKPDTWSLKNWIQVVKRVFTGTPTAWITHSSILTQVGNLFSLFFVLLYQGYNPCFLLLLLRILEELWM